ncbi:MAG TPA: hypothetical protein VLE73_03345 [Candidatus Saccharimonadales bacterium]|nr:hypothetical protein [Candidatus Saccharimonadales bacterium]
MELIKSPDTTIDLLSQPIDAVPQELNRQFFEPHHPLRPRMQVVVGLVFPGIATLIAKGYECTGSEDKSMSVTLQPDRALRFAEAYATVMIEKSTATDYMLGTPVDYIMGWCRRPCYAAWETNPEIRSAVYNPIPIATNNLENGSAYDIAAQRRGEFIDFLTILGVSNPKYSLSYIGLGPVTILPNSDILGHYKQPGDTINLWKVTTATYEPVDYS